MSAPPPGGRPTTMRTGRAGYVCAPATPQKVGSAAAPAARCRNCLRGSFIAFLHDLPQRRSDDGNRLRRGAANEIAEVRRRLVLLCRHQVAVGTEEVDLLADANIVVSFLAHVVIPLAVLGLAPEALLHRPGLGEGVVDRRDLVVK